MSVALIARPPQRHGRPCGPAGLPPFGLTAGASPTAWLSTAILAERFCSACCARPLRPIAWTHHRRLDTPPSRAPNRNLQRSQQLKKVPGSGQDDRRKGEDRRGCEACPVNRFGPSELEFTWSTPTEVKSPASQTKFIHIALARHLEISVRVLQTRAASRDPFRSIFGLLAAQSLTS